MCARSMRRRPAAGEAAHDPYLQLATAVHGEVAREWVADTPRGLVQIERIVSQLRTQFRHDPVAVAPETCQDVVRHFLAAGRGPDYMFATTAAVLLRGLGYPTRVVSGFYADPADYDRRSKQTIVRKKNVHFWVEAQVAGGHWLPLEPTPGYAEPLRLLTWQQWWARLGADWLDWASTHRFAIGIVVLLLLAAAFARRWLSDLASYGVWQMACRGEPARRVLWTVRLLEWRGRMAGSRRPGTTTFARWYAQLPADSSEERLLIRRLVCCADWALYGRRLRCRASVPRMCSRSAGAWHGRGLLCVWLVARGDSHAARTSQLANCPMGCAVLRLPFQHGRGAWRNRSGSSDSDDSNPKPTGTRLSS